MASRANAIRLIVETHLGTAISGVTIINTPTAFDSIPKDQFPAAVVVTTEEEPERLAFRQERRRVNVLATIGMLTEGTALATVIDTMNEAMEDARDAIFGDEDLGGIVNYAVADAAVAYAQADDPIVYGTLEVATEEVF